MAAPPELSAARAARGHLSVGRADVDAAVRDRRRGIEPAAVTEPRLRRGAPDPPAGPRVEAVEVAVVGADEEPVARERDGALDLVARLEAPDDLARALVECVDLAAPVADVDATARDERRALRRADLCAPPDLAEADGERDHLAVEPVAARGVARRPVHERMEDD